MSVFLAFLFAIFGWAQPHTWAHQPGVTGIGRAVTVYVAPDINPAPFVAAVAEINRYTGAHWTVTIGTNGYYRDQVQVRHGDTTPCGGDDGCTNPRIDGGRTVWAEIVLRPGAAQWVDYHELGHATGLAHVTTADVMRPGNGTYTTYQPGDIAGLRTLELR